MRVLIDIDNVCAELIDEWLRRYDEEWYDDLKREDIIDWDISQFVTPECGSKIYRYLSGNIYDTVQPVQGAVEGVNAIRDAGHTVFFLTANPSKEKLDWLKQYEFLPDDPISDRYYICCYFKYLIDGDVLIDDKLSTIRESPYPSILFNQPWNQVRINDVPMRAYSWTDVTAYVRALGAIKQMIEENKHGN